MPSGWDAAHALFLPCLPSRRHVRLHQPISSPMMRSIRSRKRKRQRHRSRNRAWPTQPARSLVRPPHVHSSPTGRRVLVLSFLLGNTLVRGCRPTHRPEIKPPPPRWPPTTTTTMNEASTAMPWWVVVTAPTPRRQDWQWLCELVDGSSVSTEIPRRCPTLAGSVCFPFTRIRRIMTWAPQRRGRAVEAAVVATVGGGGQEGAKCAVAVGKQQPQNHTDHADTPYNTIPGTLRRRYRS
jgi:hypothetical protein